MRVSVFYHGEDDMIPPIKAYTIEEKRKDYGNAYRPWNESTDNLLCQLYDKGNNINSLSKQFERTKGAIESRLKKLGKKK